MRWFNIAAAIIAVALAVGLYRAKTEADAARARVTELEQQVAASRAELKTLAAELAVLESPARIEALAKKRLGIGPAEPQQLRPEAQISALPPANKTPAAKP
jgi:cell division protein FtsL